MTGLTLFMIVGPIAMLGGVAAMIAAIRGGVGEDPKSTAMLIAGMMATAFGMLLTAFAIGSTGPATITQGAS
jgi:uncharacterized membrane protein HdeD (DUF308 family)